MYCECALKARGPNVTFAVKQCSAYRDKSTLLLNIKQAKYTQNRDLLHVNIR